MAQDFTWKAEQQHITIAGVAIDIFTQRIVNLQPAFYERERMESEAKKAIEAATIFIETYEKEVK